MMRRMLCLLALATPLAAQAGSDIWLADIVERDGAVALANVRRVTDRPGYDNQPRFTVEGDAILYTSVRDGQADIWRYDLRTGRHTRVTATPESEYSPRQQPGGRGRIGAVRVEHDSTQRLWTFNPDGTGFQVLAPEVRGVGYYDWLPDNRAFVYIVGDTSRLELVDLTTGARSIVTHDVGPTLQVIPDDPSVLFTIRDGSRARLIAWSPEQPQPLNLGLLPGGPYFVFDEARDLLFAPDSAGITALDAANPSAGYRRVAGLEGRTLPGITRLTISPDGRLMAFVAAEPE